MTRFKPVALLAAALFFVTLLIPTILVLPFGNDKASGSLGENVTAEAREYRKCRNRAYNGGCRLPDSQKNR